MNLTMSKKTNKINKQYGRALMLPDTVNIEERTVDVTFATEAPVERFGWSEDYSEVLVCEPSAVRMDRIDKGLPVIDCHELNVSVHKQIGRTTKVWFDKEKRQLCATVQFSKRIEVDALFQDVLDGIVRDVSVGYRVFKFEREDNGADKLPTYRAIDWMPFEISFVSVPADSDASVRSSEQENEVEVIHKNRFIKNKKRSIMKITCPECGHEWETDQDGVITCPECGAEFEVDSEGDAIADTVVPAEEVEDDEERSDSEEEKEDEERKGKRTINAKAIRSQATKQEKARLNAILLSSRDRKSTRLNSSH